MLLDAGVGILSAIVTSKLFESELGWSLVMFGIAASLLPDIDILFHIQSGKNVRDHKGQEHRDLWHYPLLYIPLGTAVTALFSPSYAFLFAVASFLHFVHDSIGIGWGVQWLFPFSKRHFSFIYHYDVHRNGLPKQWIYSWKHDEVAELSEKYGDRNWIENIYLKWHPYAVIELLAGVLSLVVLIYMIMK